MPSPEGGTLLGVETVYLKVPTLNVRVSSYPAVLVMGDWSIFRRQLPHLTATPSMEEVTSMGSPPCMRLFIHALSSEGMTMDSSMSRSSA